MRYRRKQHYRSFRSLLIRYCCHYCFLDTKYAISCWCITGILQHKQEANVHGYVIQFFILNSKGNYIKLNKPGRAWDPPASSSWRNPGEADWNNRYNKKYKYYRLPNQQYSGSRSRKAKNYPQKKTTKLHSSSVPFNRIAAWHARHRIQCCGSGFAWIRIKFGGSR